MRFIVAGILEVAVSQHVPAQHPGVEEVGAEVFVDRANGIVPLLINWQVIEQVALCFRTIFLQVGIELHVIDGTEADNRNLVFRIYLIFIFHLKVVVGRQKRESDKLEKQLKIRLTGRHDEGGFLADRAIHGESRIGGSDTYLCVNAVAAAIFLADIHDRAEAIGAVGRKSAAVEVHLPHKVGVDDTHHTSRGALCGKVIDDGDFNAVEIKHILRRPTSAHNQVVPVGIGSPHTGQRLYGFGDVAVYAGSFFNVAYTHSQV